MAQDPPQEQLNHFIGSCIPEPRVVNVLVEGSNEIVQVEVFVAGMSYERVYMVADEIRPPTRIQHGGPDWGAVHYGYALERIQGNEIPVFLFPADAADRFLVAIKRLEKRIFEPLLARGATRENPYREIHRMQTPSLMDGGYVHPLVEALEDEHYLYIITPFADEGDLQGSIPLEPRENMPVELQAFQVYRQMLGAVNHIHNNPHIRGQFGIGHRDIKPQNFFVRQGGIYLADFAMSYPVPPGDMVNHMGGFGTPPYLPPEIAQEAPFSAIGCDLWACTVSLFNLVTGMPVYYMPLPTDLFFVFNIMARGLSNDPNSEMIEAVLEEADDVARDALRQMWQHIQGLSPPLRELLSNVLELAPDQRWNMQDVQNSAWMLQAAAVLDA
mmetsp:Transcript_22683/g.56046  ORF Transcript_22683/g.56046 Transcript_22683/m.56046 type:complete len:385 (-) Transcript_22683:2090-3244(-)